jgi:branched-chain amino acid transport system ATP-binding protein
MLAIARALIQNPDIFLMDEPSEGLSPLIVSEVGALIKQLNAEGNAFLIVEQNLAFALSVAHRVLIMNKGTIVYSGTPDEIRNDPEIGCRFLGMGVTSAE